MADKIELRIQINEKANSIQVFAPYHPDFIKAMRSCNATWDKPQGCWWVGITHLSTVRSAMHNAFGANDIYGQINLKLTFLEDQGQLQGDYKLFGKTICHATSRNSGGSPGFGVKFLAGKPESGGSVKNWLSVVPAGSVVLLKDVERSKLSTTTIPKGVKAEFHNELPVGRNGLYLALMEAIDEANKVVQLGRFRKDSLQDRTFTSNLEEAAGKITFLLEEIKKHQS